LFFFLAQGKAIWHLKNHGPGDRAGIRWETPMARMAEMLQCFYDAIAGRSKEFPQISAAGFNGACLETLPTIRAAARTRKRWLTGCCLRDRAEARGDSSESRCLA
jgi:hypothetical protein